MLSNENNWRSVQTAGVISPCLQLALFNIGNVFPACNKQLTQLNAANAKQSNAFGGHQQGCGMHVKIKYFSMLLQS